MIIAQGGAFGGWSLYVKDGRPAYCYNLFGLQQFKVDGETRRPAGEHQVRMEFAYDGGGLGKGGDGDAVRRRRPRSARAASTPPCRCSSPATRPPTSAATAARRSATTTARATSRFTGRVRWVQIDLDDDAEDVDHLITPEERLRIAMARQ